MRDGVTDLGREHALHCDVPWLTGPGGRVKNLELFVSEPPGSLTFAKP
jgi:hypothetical protein